MTKPIVSNINWESLHFEYSFGPYIDNSISLIILAPLNMVMCVDKLGNFWTQYIILSIEAGELAAAAVRDKFLLAKLLST